MCIRDSLSPPHHPPPARSRARDRPAPTPLASLENTDARRRPTSSSPRTPPRRSRTPRTSRTATDRARNSPSPAHRPTARVTASTSVPHIARARASAPSRAGPLPLDRIQSIFSHPSRVARAVIHGVASRAPRERSRARRSRRLVVDVRASSPSRASTFDGRGRGRATRRMGRPIGTAHT